MLKLFPIDTLKTILNGRFNPSRDTIRGFFSKIRALFFNFQKRGGEASPQLRACICMYVYILSRTSDFVNGEKSICMKDVIMCTN